MLGRRGVSAPEGASKRSVAPRFFAGLLVVAGLLAVASPAQAATTASFTWSPSAPVSGQTVTFTSTSTAAAGRTITSYGWDLDNNGQFNDGSAQTATRTFSAPGSYTVRLHVVDSGGGSSTSTQTVTVGNAPPVASFTYSPSAPLSRQTITFTSTSSDVDGHIASQGWDLGTGNQFTDATTASVTKAITWPGTYTIRLRVTDDKGASSTTSQKVTVGDRPPVASFDSSPAAPRAGDSVTLTSTSTDPDSLIASQAWDLNGDGKFDDATGATATQTFPAAGSYPVSLLVTDSFGETNTVERTITVSPAAAASEAVGFDTTGAPPAIGTPIGVLPIAVPHGPGVMSPFPVVRVRGRATRSATKVTSFTVRAPAGSSLKIYCGGRSCPRRAIARVVRGAGKAPVVRIRSLEKELRAGTRIEVRITEPGFVGKYTRLVIRKLAAPLRVDSCLLPGSVKPSTCPSK